MIGTRTEAPEILRAWRYLTAKRLSWVEFFVILVLSRILKAIIGLV